MSPVPTLRYIYNHEADGVKPIVSPLSFIHSKPQTPAMQSDIKRCPTNLAPVDIARQTNNSDNQRDKQTRIDRIFRRSQIVFLTSMFCRKFCPRHHKSCLANGRPCPVYVDQSFIHNLPHSQSR